MEGLIFVNEHLHCSTFWNEFFKCITFLGEAGIVWIVLGIILLCFKKTRISGLVLLVSLGIGFVFNDLVLKQLFARPRPFAINPDFERFLNSISMPLPSGFSMPSGHSYVAFNACVILTCFYKKKGSVSFILGILIAVSRIFLCVHYPTDVLVGAGLGSLTAILVFCCFRCIQRKSSARKREKIRSNEV